MSHRLIGVAKVTVSHRRYERVATRISVALRWINSYIIPEWNTLTIIAPINNVAGLIIQLLSRFVFLAKDMLSKQLAIIFTITLSNY